MGSEAEESEQSKDGRSPANSAFKCLLRAADFSGAVYFWTYVLTHSQTSMIHFSRIIQSQRVVPFRESRCAFCKTCSGQWKRRISISLRLVKV